MSTDDIVVVDDDEMVAEFASRVLRGSGRTLRAFSDPFDAFEHLVANAPKVLLVDTRMPGMSGTELIGRLADGGHLDGVRTILCSAGRASGVAAGAPSEHPALPPGLERLSKEVLYDRATLLERLFGEGLARAGAAAQPSRAAESSGSASNRSATRP